MKPSPQVAVIVVSYNTRALLLDCLNSIVESTGSLPVEIVVVDNASADGSADAVEAYGNVALIRNEVNRGFGVACNQAIRSTSAPLILLLNSDARLTPQSFITLREVLNLNPRCGAAGCRTVNSDGVATPNTWNFLTPYNQALELLGIVGWLNSRALKRSYNPRRASNESDCTVDWIDGACLMVRRAALDEVGLFDERFFIYSEDEDLCFRLKRRGWTVCHSFKGTAMHRGAASTSQKAPEMLKHFYFSQMLFLKKHHGDSSVALYLAAMRAVIALKQLLPFSKVDKEVLRQRQRALQQARSLRNENQLDSPRP